MTRAVVTLNESESLRVADQIMRLDRIRHMPVVSGERVVGVLSQRDLFRATVSSLLNLRPDAAREWLAKIPVRDAMVAPPVTVAPDTPVGDAVALMLDKRIGCLPVVENDKLVGLITETDCLRCFGQLHEEEELKRQLR